MSTSTTFHARRMLILFVKQGKVGKGPRYAVYDFSYDLASGEGTRYASEICFCKATFPNTPTEARSLSSPGLQMMPAFR